MILNVKHIDINDIIFLIGLGCMTTGLWLYSPSVSLSATGGILMWAGYARAGGENK